MYVCCCNLYPTDYRTSRVHFLTAKVRTQLRDPHALYISELYGMHRLGPQVFKQCNCITCTINMMLVTPQIMYKMPVM